jgi:hypothetical protein
MYNFCTLFDSHYFSRGIALYESLAEVCDDFHLYVFAFDDPSLHALQSLQVPHMTVISLAEFEDDDLLRVKPGRSIAEYCWTCTSSTILYVLQRFHVDQCTYLDADIYFYSSPSVLFEEMGDASILITEHRYTPKYNKAKKSGTYCVQFISFRNDTRGLNALRWWRERCIEWCFARLEDGKFGDQLYLEDWPQRFEGVHVLEHLGGGLAAWNIQQYEIKKNNNLLQGREYSTGKIFPAVFYHFHYVKFFRNGLVELGRRQLSSRVLDLIYRPYVQVLLEIGARLEKQSLTFDPHGLTEYRWTWKTPILSIYRRLTQGYHIYSLDTLIKKDEDGGVMKSS